MQETDDLTPLGHQILEHWSRYRPGMVAALTEQNRLSAAIFAAQQLTSHLFLIRTDGRAEDGLSDGLGTGDEGVGVSSGRGGSAPVVVRSGHTEPEPTLARDYRITESDRIGQGSLRDKARTNLTAIRALKRIEGEARTANPEGKAELVNYTGRSAMPGVFEALPAGEWKGIANELEELLTPEEFASARASTPNAHYTSPEVIRAIWKAMEGFGFQAGGRVLEPSMGVGHFFGFMPKTCKACPYCWRRAVMPPPAATPLIFMSPRNLSMTARGVFALWIRVAPAARHHRRSMILLSEPTPYFHAR
jgi:hypothetical protein